MLHALFLLGYLVLFGGLLLLLRVTHTVPARHLEDLDFLLLSLATFRLTQIVTEEKVARFLRKPFVTCVPTTHPDGSVTTEEQPGGAGFRRTVGELLLCPWCLGVWIATLLTFFHALAPEVAHLFLLALAVAAAAILFQILAKLMDRARECLAGLPNK